MSRESKKSPICTPREVMRKAKPLSFKSKAFAPEDFPSPHDWRTTDEDEINTGENAPAVRLFVENESTPWKPMVELVSKLLATH